MLSSPPNTASSSTPPTPQTVTSDPRHAAMETYWREVHSIEEEKEGEEEEDEEEKKSMDGKRESSKWDIVSLWGFYLSLFTSRGGDGGDVAHGGGIVLPGYGSIGGRGEATVGWSAAVHADATTSRHGEEEAGQLQRDTEEEKQAANQRRPWRLHPGGKHRLMHGTLYETYLNCCRITCSFI